MLTIDHFTLGAANLSSGRDEFEALTGARLPMGGKHPMMSTHNCLTATGERQFFELIAIDEEAPAPDRTRWFSLDEARTKARLSKGISALCWVVETNDLDKLVAASPIDLGDILTLTRGSLTWRLTVPKDGSLVEQGILPAFIQWPEGVHPSKMQEDIGLSLNEVIVHHPDPTWLADIAYQLGIDGLMRIEEGAHALAFDVNTPKGRLVLA